jgi:hypothetical protein
MTSAPSLYRVFWEQPFIDLWTIPHTLIGVIFIYLARRWKLNLWAGLVFSIAFAFMWEILEFGTGVSEAEFFYNHASDILVTQIGYTAGWLVFAKVSEEEEARIIKWVGGVFVVVAVAGFICAKVLGPK